MIEDICWTIAYLAVLTALLLTGVMYAREALGIEGYDPYWIDYNAPGVDITSEGP